MIGYKGFDENLMCSGFQFDLHKEYEVEVVELKKSGFHFCENPIEVFNYYPPSNSVYCEIIADQVCNEKDDEDSKRASKRIKINRKLSMCDYVKTIINFLKKYKKESLKETDDFYSISNNENDFSVSCNNGFQSISNNSGFRSVSVTNGDKSISCNTGNRSVSLNNGDYSVSISSGDKSLCENNGFRGFSISNGLKSSSVVNCVDSIAISSGIKGRVKGVKDSWIGCCEWVYDNGEWKIVDFKSVKVDGENIKENTFYSLVDGNFVES